MGMMDRFRKAGGFLNNVDALIVDLTFTNAPDFGEASREQKAGEFTPLWLTLSTRADGAEKPETTNLNMGGGDDFVISEDGHSLIPSSKDSMLWSGTPGFRFIASGYVNGIPEPNPEPGEPLDFSNFIGYRVRFTQVVDTDGMARMAKKVKANPRKYPKYNAEGQRKGKGIDGKFYDQKNPEISAVYGKVEEERPTQGPGAKKQSAATKTNSATTKGSNGKATNGSGKATDTEALATFAGETLVKLLQEHDGELKKTQLNQFVTRSLAKDARREDVRKYLFQDDVLKGFATDGITVGDDFYTVHFDQSGRDQIISLQQ